MVINECNSMDRLPLHKSPIPDRSHIEIRPTISCFFEIIVEGNIHHAELDVFEKDARLGVSID